ncbi:MAG: glycosyltransferase family 39 protein [Fimbriimonadaceae bacterium]|nr:glycosyltransferase family 39 protein [Fimbriimonadaceae bacterium]QYK55498.1 MAG: glycosyltransferase family 39 protein [Fimbriimonadaceae bacterium]
MGKPESTTTSASPLLIGLAVFFFAFVLRAAGIGWGTPYEQRHWSLHPDEPVVALFASQVDPLSGDLVPTAYNYGTLYLSLLSVADRVAGAWSPVEVTGPADAWRLFARTQAVGRWMSLLAGSAMAWVAFATLRRRTNVLGAVLGGLAVAFAPGLVVHSRFQTVDVLSALFVALSLYWALRLEEPGSEPGGRLPDQPLPQAALAGLFAGLSAGTKYSGGLVVLALLVVCLVQRRWREAAIGIGAAALAFLMTTPGALLDTAAFWRDFAFEASHTSTGHGLVFAGTSSGFLYHLGNLSLAFGSLLSLAGFVGLVRGTLRREASWIGTAVFFCAFYFLIGRAEVKFLRYVFPLIPVLALGFGSAMGEAHARAGRLGRGIVAAGILALGGLFGGGLWLSTQATAAMASVDPRDDAGDWLREELQTKTVGLVSDAWFYTPTLYPEAAAPRFLPPGLRALPPRVLRYQPTDGSPAKDWDVRLLDLAPDRVVFSSFEIEGVERLRNLPEGSAARRAFTGQLEDYVAFVTRLQREYRLERVFPQEAALHPSPLSQAHDLMYVRPIIWVWTKKTDSSSSESSSSTTSSSSGRQAPTQ